MYLNEGWNQCQSKYLRKSNSAKTVQVLKDLTCRSSLRSFNHLINRISIRLINRKAIKMKTLYSKHDKALIRVVGDSDYCWVWRRLVLRTGNILKHRCVRCAKPAIPKNVIFRFYANQ